MIALAWKELGELRGLVFLAVVQVLVVGVCHAILPLHLFGAEPILGYLTADISLVGCLAAFAAGHSRFGPEVQTGTLAFLDALPTSRHRVFLVKVIVGWLPTGLTALGLLLVKVIALSAWPAPNAAQALLLAVALAFLSGALMTAHYAVGLVLSWFGEVGWQAFLISLVTLLFVTVTIPAAVDWYPMFAGSFDVTLVSGLPRFSPWPPLGWCLLSGGTLLLAYVLFIGPGERIARGSGWARLALQALVYAPPVMGIALLVLMSLLTSAIYLPSLIQPTFRASTPHFRVLATAANRADGEAIVAGSESIREQLVERFGSPGPASLDVELTGASEHLGGVFVPGKVQLRTDADLQVFAHELSHAFSHHLGDVSHHQRAWRFFEEGLATHNEGLVGPPESQAATPARGTASADWLLAADSQLRSIRFDPDADYALGQIWVEALIELGGYEAVQCVIRRASAPNPGLDAVPWWYALLDHCQIDFSELIVAYQARLPERDVPEHYGWVAGESLFGFEVMTTASRDGQAALCFVRSGPGAQRTEYRLLRAAPGEACWVPKSEIAGSRPQVAVGYRESDGLRFSEWRFLGAR